MIYLKNSKEIEIMRQAGRIAALALGEVEKHVRIGASTKKLDEVALSVIRRHKAQPSFKKVPNYKHCICTTPNSWVVHGIPGNYFLKKGDIIGVDLGAFYKGYHSDVARTYLVEDSDEKKKQFLKIGDKALRESVKEAKAGNKIGDVLVKIFMKTPWFQVKVRKVRDQRSRKVWCWQ
jgi:methionyl aminopeptidase